MFNKIQLILIVILIPMGLLFAYSKSKDTPISELFFPAIELMHIGEIPVRIEIVDTPELREQGLSGRSEIGDQNGMLFVFNEPDYHSIWMKDMQFAIDVVWISPDLTVVGVEKNVTPNTYPKSFRPPKPVLYILETDVHYTDTMGIRVGDKVRLPKTLEAAVE